MAYVAKGAILMSENCPICGCKTEELDFVEINTESGVISVCDYCGKQISVLKAADMNDADSIEKIKPKLRWLDAAIEKQTENRCEACEKSLQELRGKFPAGVIETTEQADGGQSIYTKSPIMDTTATSEADKNRIIQLEKRIESLEAEFHNHKRMSIIMSIAEFVVPAIILSIIAMVFFKSDLWADLSSIIYSATGGYSLF